MSKKQKVLFFVDGYAPSAADREAAAAIDGKVMFRNARVIRSEDATETADAVAGVVPISYAHFKRADELADEIGKEAEKVAKRTTKRAGKPAPEVVPEAVTATIEPVQPPVDDGNIAEAAGWAPNN